MQYKGAGIIVSIIIGGIIIGAITLGQDNSNDSFDKYAIDGKTVLAQLQNHIPVLVVDIRTAEQFQAGHLQGSAHDNLNSVTLEKRITTIQSCVKVSKRKRKYNSCKHLAVGRLPYICYLLRNEC